MMEEGGQWIHTARIGAVTGWIQGVCHGRR